ncbi:MAG: GABA permease [Firmicutes bacterium ADurb.Bin182]|nr:MAG: GABA permease [Firmicutes bacterium ADurb.Bin182]
MEQKLKRKLTFLQMIALASGAVIGGWLAEAPYWFSLTGAGAAFIFPLLAILLIPVGYAFGELTAMLPFASSIDVWTVNAFGRKMGWAAQWMMFLVQVVEPPMMAFIFLTAINYFIPVPAMMAVWVAIGICIVWYILSNFNISLTGKLATILFFSMIVISLAVAVMFFTSGSWSVTNITSRGGFFPMGGRGIFVALAVFSLKFIGFELTPTLIEETTFKAKNMWKVVLSALFIPALLYFIVVMAMGGVAPWNEVKEMSMPEPEIISKLSLPAIFGILAIIAGLMHAFTTLMGFWVSSARVLYGSAQLNQLPKVFMKVNRFGQPHVSNLVILLFSIFFCLFTGDNWVQYIYAVSCIAAGLVYMMVCLDAIALRKKHPEWNRPYKAPIGTPLFIFGALVSVWIIVGSCLELPVGGYISLGIYAVIGVVLYVVMHFLRKKNPKELAHIVLTPDDIEKEAAL